MAKGEIPVKKTDTILDELDRLHQAISRRAYDLFRNGGASGGETANWLNAERELISKPAVELREKGGRFEVVAALPGIDAKDVDLQITPDDLLIKAETTHEHPTDSGTVHMCEFSSGTVFRSIRFPKPIDPASAKAEHKNGMLHVTAAIRKAPASKKVNVEVTERPVR